MRGRFVGTDAIFLMGTSVEISGSWLVQQSMLNGGVSSFRAISCAVSERTVRIFADSRVVVLFVALSIASALFTAVARTELALTLFLSILSLAITAAILYVGETREKAAHRRDEAMHAKLDSLLRGVADADERLAGSEKIAPLQDAAE